MNHDIPRISETFQQRIVGELATRGPDPDLPREEQWWTLTEIRALVTDLQSAFATDHQLDAALRAWYRSDPNCKIRPAFYPGEHSCKRLWRHTQYDDENAASRERLLETFGAVATRSLESVKHYLPAGKAPVVFLSHALHDHHFAARVRLQLAMCGIEAWIAEGDAKDSQGELFEAVRVALGRCDALFMLLSSVSITSAWVFTEGNTALHRGKRIFAVVDANDEAICALVDGWLANCRATIDSVNLQTWLATSEGKRQVGVVRERFVEAAPRDSRVEKFEDGVEILFKWLAFIQDEREQGAVAFYPSRPAVQIHGSGHIDFSEIVAEVKESVPT